MQKYEIILFNTCYFIKKMYLKEHFVYTSVIPKSDMPNTRAARGPWQLTLIDT